MSAVTAAADEIQLVNVIRALSADVVRKANSGHPGMPLGMAPVAHVLWSRVMRFDSSSPSWANRDRFVLSNGHGCALLYSMLHLSGYSDVTMDALKSFRQWDSKCPGHPENHVTAGVEVTTGPLGQGIGNAVGMAIAQRHAAALFNKPGFEELCNNTVYAFCGDGCLQEGVSSEASSVAGHLGLGNLVVVYDDNNITIDGDTSLSFSEDVPARYRAYGWHTLTVGDGDADLKGIEEALKVAKSVTDKPTLITLKTTIGFMSEAQGTHGVHGSPLAPADIAQLKTKAGLDPEASFAVTPEAVSHWKSVAAKGRDAHKEWDTLFAKYTVEYPELAAQFLRMHSKELPADWKANLPSFPAGTKADATRNISGKVLNVIADAVPEIFGGCADLTPSTKTELKSSSDFQASTPEGRYLRFGVREHGMCAIANGIAAYGCFIPFTSTFLNFVSYSFPAVRLSALSGFQHIGILTHDSIGLGEDGPTHQPVEILTLLRALPNHLTFRPADGNETVGSYVCAVENRGGPSSLCLSRQNLPTLEMSSADSVSRGAYPVNVESNPEVVLIATGSEVSLALDAAKLLGMRVRVVSAPCLELFDAQAVSYRRELLPVGVPVISVEAAGLTGWSKYAHHSLGVQAWGASAPAERIYEEYGLVPDKVAASVKSFLSAYSSVSSSFGALVTHLD